MCHAERSEIGVWLTREGAVVATPEDIRDKVLAARA
jgi:hypothetical protein